MAASMPAARKMPVPPKAPPPPHLRQAACEGSPLTHDYSEDDDHGGRAHHGVAELQTDGVGENADGQVIDTCAVKFKNLTLHLDKAAFKLYLIHQLSMSDDGIY